MSYRCMESEEGHRMRSKYKRIMQLLKEWASYFLSAMSHHNFFFCIFNDSTYFYRTNTTYWFCLEKKLTMIIYISALKTAFTPSGASQWTIRASSPSTSPWLPVTTRPSCCKSTSTHKSVWSCVCCNCFKVLYVSKC